MVHTGYISQILKQFDQNPTAARKLLRSAWEDNPDEFRVSAVPLLAQREETVGQRFLVSFLLQNDNLVATLGDHSKLTREEAVTIARVALKMDPSLDLKLAMQLATHVISDEKSARRVLDILDSVSNPGNLLPMLSNILQHPDPKVRSKAALLMGKGNRNAQWVHNQLSETDERIRANAVESVWGMTTGYACNVFRIAARDPHQRTAVNGMLGLYFAGHLESIRMLYDAAGSDSSSLRASAAWAMGRTQDPRFLNGLTKLVRDNNTAVRSNALKSVARIRNYRNVLEAHPFTLRITEGQLTPEGMRRLRGTVRLKANSVALPPLSFVIEEDGAPIFQYEVSSKAITEATVGIVIPSRTEMRDTQASELETGWASAIGSRVLSESWGVACYVNTESSRGPVPVGYSNTLEGVVRLRESSERSPFSGFFAALSALMQALPRHGERALVVIGAGSAEAANLVLKRQLGLERLIRDAKEAGIRVHTVLPTVCAPILRVSLRQISDGTGGACLSASDTESFAKILSNTLPALFPTFELRYQGKPRTSPAKISLLTHSPQGIGECRAELAIS